MHYNITRTELENMEIIILRFSCLPLSLWRREITSRSLRKLKTVYLTTTFYVVVIMRNEKELIMRNILVNKGFTLHKRHANYLLLENPSLQHETDDCLTSFTKEHARTNNIDTKIVGVAWNK